MNAKRFSKAAMWTWYYKRRRAGIPKPSLTGCECHEFCNESYFAAHPDVKAPEPALSAPVRTADDYVEVNGVWVKR